MHEGIYGITTLTMKNIDECTGYLAFRKAHYRSGGTYSQVAQIGDEVGGGLSGVFEMEESLIQEFCGRTLAEQAKLNLDKARQKTAVLKYANYFRKQLLELPHRHEEDNVHDFQRGLRPSIHKEVAMKTLIPYTRRFILFGGSEGDRQ
jgi:hypothetical protein